MFRNSPPEVLSRKKFPQTRSKSAGEQQFRSAISTKPLCNFIKITPAHRQAPDNLQHIHRTNHPGDHLWGTAFACKKSFLKDLNYKKLLFIVVKRNLLTEICGAVVWWLSLLCDFIQLSLNSGSAEVQTLLAACRRFATVRISDNGPGLK